MLCIVGFCAFGLPFADMEWKFAIESAFVGREGDCVQTVLFCTKMR